MYQGKHVNKTVKNGTPKRKRRLRWKKEFVILCSVLVLIVGMVGGSIAYLITNTGAITNTFTPAKNQVDIQETFDKDTKSDVTFKNSSDFPVRIRATYIANWVDDDGNVYPSALEAKKDYTIELGSGWDEKGDGYWLYTSTVGVGGSTGVFIKTLTPIDSAAPDGCHLEVEVICESVQAEPSTAMADVWGY